MASEHTDTSMMLECPDTAAYSCERAIACDEKGEDVPAVPPVEGPCWFMHHHIRVARRRGEFRTVWHAETTVYRLMQHVYDFMTRDLRSKGYGVRIEESATIFNDITRITVSWERVEIPEGDESSHVLKRALEEIGFVCVHCIDGKTLLVHTNGPTMACTLHRSVMRYYIVPERKLDEHELPSLAGQALMSMRSLIDKSPIRLVYAASVVRAMDSWTIELTPRNRHCAEDYICPTPTGRLQVENRAVESSPAPGPGSSDAVQRQELPPSDRAESSSAHVEHAPISVQRSMPERAPDASQTPVLRVLDVLVGNIAILSKAMTDDDMQRRADVANKGVGASAMASGVHKVDPARLMLWRELNEAFIRILGVWAPHIDASAPTTAVSHCTDNTPKDDAPAELSAASTPDPQWRVRMPYDAADTTKVVDVDLPVVRMTGREAVGSYQQTLARKKVEEVRRAVQNVCDRLARAIDAGLNQVHIAIDSGDYDDHKPAYDKLFAELKARGFRHTFQYQGGEHIALKSPMPRWVIMMHAISWKAIDPLTADCDQIVDALAALEYRMECVHGASFTATCPVTGGVFRVQTGDPDMPGAIKIECCMSDSTELRDAMIKHLVDKLGMSAAFAMYHISTRETIHPSGDAKTLGVCLVPRAVPQQDMQ